MNKASRSFQASGQKTSLYVSLRVLVWSLTHGCRTGIFLVFLLCYCQRLWTQTVDRWQLGQPALNMWGCVFLGLCVCLHVFWLCVRAGADCSIDSSLAVRAWFMSQEAQISLPPLPSHLIPSPSNHREARGIEEIIFQCQGWQLWCTGTILSQVLDARPAAPLLHI